MTTTYLPTRPDRPLVVKCTFDRWTKRISFSSARNCTFDLLRHKIEQCFSLYSTPYNITYKDDDGEIYDVGTEMDLTEAVAYFQAGADDPHPISTSTSGMGSLGSIGMNMGSSSTNGLGLGGGIYRSTSSSASILSGRSLTFGSRKITMRVSIAVEYDGPNLSDTSSLVSMEEYRQRMDKGGGGSNWDDFDLEEGEGEVDDDSVTVSSRDAYAPSISLSSDLRPESTHSSELSPDSRSGSKFSSTTPSSSLTPSSLSSDSDAASPPLLQPKDSDPFASRASSTYSLSPSPHHPSHQHHPHYPSSQYSHSHSHAQRDSIDSITNQHPSTPAASWLAQQNERRIRGILGALPAPSESDLAEDEGGYGGGDYEGGDGDGSGGLSNWDEESSLGLGGGRDGSGKDGVSSFSGGTGQIGTGRGGRGEGSMASGSGSVSARSGDLALQRDGAGKSYYLYVGAGSNGEGQGESGRASPTPGKMRMDVDDDLPNTPVDDFSSRSIDPALSTADPAQSTADPAQSTEDRPALLPITTDNPLTHSPESEEEIDGDLPPFVPSSPVPGILGRGRPNSMQLRWLESQRVPFNLGSKDKAREVLSPGILASSASQSPRPPTPTGSTSTSSIPSTTPTPTPRPLSTREDLLILTGPPEDEVTACAECGVGLESIRYICKSCGVREPGRPTRRIGNRDSMQSESSHGSSSREEEGRRLFMQSGTSGSGRASSEWTGEDEREREREGLMTMDRERMNADTRDWDARSIASTSTSSAGSMAYPPPAHRSVPPPPPLPPRSAYQQGSRSGSQSSLLSLAATNSIFGGRGSGRGEGSVRGEGKTRAYRPLPSIPSSGTLRQLLPLRWGLGGGERGSRATIGTGFHGASGNGLGASEGGRMGRGGEPPPVPPRPQPHREYNQHHHQNQEYPPRTAHSSSSSSSGSAESGSSPATSTHWSGAERPLLPRSGSGSGDRRDLNGHGGSLEGVNGSSGDANGSPGLANGSFGAAIGSLGPASPGVRGYELCGSCIEGAGVRHAIEGAAGVVGSPGAGHGASSPSYGYGAMEEDDEERAALSMWRRSAPKEKGRLRHAYLEKVWGYGGWVDLQQEEVVLQCSMCQSATIGRRYKCISCQNLTLCVACYSQVHDIHPLHAFLIIQDKAQDERERGRIEHEVIPPLPPDMNDEEALRHTGIKCFHCMLEIVGARYHCAICESIDICSNCEAAGLPGNLDSTDDGHNSSHIMIKIPYPLPPTEVVNASRRAVDLWTGRDAAANSLGSSNSPSGERRRRGSDASSHAGTVIASGSSPSTRDRTTRLDWRCNGCSELIAGVRYQCANCPSLRNSVYSLCENCERRSHVLHDPKHAFFKIPRPLDKQIESAVALLPLLYKTEVGAGSNNSPDYLADVYHSSAVCDRCMQRIHGAWFRCAYCAKDLCWICEEMDTHNEKHIFIVFKSPVNLSVFRRYTDLEHPTGGPPLIPYPVYN